MNAAERRDRIVEYLRIKPISHGQIYTFQIAIPESEVVELPFEKREQLKMSLTQQGTNLIPLIVRRTEAYSEEEEYEVVYGADWCLVAKELDIEKLWVWVFNLTDEQAAAAKQEMQQLLGYSEAIPLILPSVADETESDKAILKQDDKLFSQIEALNKKIEQVATSVKKIDIIEQKIEKISAIVKNIEEAETKQIINHKIIEDLNNKLEKVVQSVKILESFTGNLPEVAPIQSVKPQKININIIRNAKELERYKIPHIGKKTAEAIIKLREHKGKFQSLAELIEVNGITERRIKDFDAYLFCE
ncbi:MAG: helix-hairpin-helix domain-containing protein [Gloeotrichia echinulata IR180]